MKPSTLRCVWSIGLIAFVSLPWLAVGQELKVRTEYRALVLHYNPRVYRDGRYQSVQEAYGYRDVDVLCRDFTNVLRRASGGQVNWTVVEKYVLEEYPPETDPDVTFTPENFEHYRSIGYDIFNTAKADYLAICRDARFQIVPKVESGLVDAVWVFGPEYTGFWETAMAGRDAYWINGGAYPEIECAKRFVIYGFGMASHQGVGFMLENTAHMVENILGNRIASGWPPSHRLIGWTTLNLNNPNRARRTWTANDWDYFTVSDAVHWNVKLVAPGQSQAGLSHFPPTACVNYGWSAARFEFDYPWEAEGLQIVDGGWSLGDGEYRTTGAATNRLVLIGSHDLRDATGTYRVPVIITDADVETELVFPSGTAASYAGVMLRCSRWSPSSRPVHGYTLGLNRNLDRIEIARTRDGHRELLLATSWPVETGVVQPLRLSVRGTTISVARNAADPPVLSFTNAVDWIDGGVGLWVEGEGVSFRCFRVTPLVANHAEAWRTYPVLGSDTRWVSPANWKGDGDPYEDNDLWFAWWYEHLPKNPGFHDVLHPASGLVLGKALNSWWPYIFDINTFTAPFLPDQPIVSAPADVAPPEAPLQVRGSAMDSRRIHLDWEEPPDNIGVTRYEIWRGETRIAETPLRHFADLGVSAGREYTYRVHARDGSGNVSEPCPPVVVRTPEAESLLLNGNFESGLDTPSSWLPQGNDAAWSWGQMGAGRNGTRCVCVEALIVPTDARWAQEIAGLEPNTRYRLHGWIKGANITLQNGGTIGANLCAAWTDDYSQPTLVGTFDWTPVSALVYADSRGRLTVGCRLGYWGSLATGTAWFDDLSLVPAPPEAQAVEVWGGDFSHFRSGMPDDMRNVARLDAADSHALALMADGSVVAWGNNAEGKALVPPGLGPVIGIGAGGSHNLVVKADGTVAAWGNNIHGQTDVPPGLSNVVAVAAGSRFSLALTADGNVTGWGGNDWGELEVPPDLAGVVAIAAGHEFSLALKADGTLTAWGSFQDADENVFPAYVPAGVEQVVGIACGMYHALALRSDGSVLSWGVNDAGQTNVPPGLDRVVAIAAGMEHSLALTDTGEVVAWGGNQFGQTAVPAGTACVRVLACAPYCSLALMGDGPPAFTASPLKGELLGDAFRISFPSVRGRPYFLETKASLDGPAWALGRAVLALEETSRFLDPVSYGGSRFYRVRLQL